MGFKLFVICTFLFGVVFVNGSAIGKRGRRELGEEKDETSTQDENKEVAESKNTKRQFVFYPHGEGYGHHHHRYHERFYDIGHGGGYHGGDLGLHEDDYHDHDVGDYYDGPQEYEHVHHQYKHIHHVSKYRMFLF